MSLAIVRNGQPIVPGASIRQTVTIAGDTSYPNPAGYVLTPASFGFTILRTVPALDPCTVAATAWWPIIIPTYSADGNSIISCALHLIVNLTGAELANGVTCATFVGTFIAEGN